MAEPCLNINTVLENNYKTVSVPYNATTTAEDVCIYVCKQLNVGTIARHLFALRVSGKTWYLKSSAKFAEIKYLSFDLRIRFKVAHISRLRQIDPKAYEYYFYQARNDVLANNIPDFPYEKYKKELIGLGITDMYRVMLEKDITRESVESDYKKYIPKEVLKRHYIFIKKPIHDTLGKLGKSSLNAEFVKSEYLKQLDNIAPEYLTEVYKAVIDQKGLEIPISVKMSPYHPTEPGLKYCMEPKKDEWIHLCSIDDVAFISIRVDGTVEISRKNGIPFYLKLDSVEVMFSFISLLDGYYRLTCKWTFNICKETPTPSLQRLYAMRCHGPVGGEFSYAKLDEKRQNSTGCFIIRESESKYNNYYIDLCMNKSLKTFKLERITGDEFIFNDDLTRYKSIQQLMLAYNNPNGDIFLKECLPPSEYDVSPLLLCRSERLSGDSVTASTYLEGMISGGPMCINCRDLQVYKGYKKNQFNFYSALGENVFWAFPFCLDDFECDVHTTAGSQFQQFWPLRAKETALEFSFHLRAVHSVAILFVPSPVLDFPAVRFDIQRHNEISRISVVREGLPVAVVKELALDGLLDYWQWREFSITFFADTMQFYWTRSVGAHLIFELKHQVFQQIRWFSPSSERLAHWTFFCQPPEVSKPPPAFLPECALNKDEHNYQGTQAVTADGLPCIPWFSDLVPQDSSSFLGDAHKAAWNYCRKPGDAIGGTFCFTPSVDNQAEGKVERKACEIRKCKSEECRMAGTANDYVGNLNRTRSNRTCQFWTQNNSSGNPVVNGSLFPDLTLQDAQNFCRNPARDPLGTWCYPIDGSIEQDLCDVRDCDRPEEHIILTKKQDGGRPIYILPQWKITGLEFGVKQWNPDVPDGIAFEVTPHNGSDKIRLLLGAEGNEKVVLLINGEKIREKTFPHLIASGKWTDFWFLIKQGEISFGFKGVPTSLFEYLHPDVFDPMFLSFGSMEEDSPMGFFFKNDECHTENTTSEDLNTKVMPIGLWSENEKPVHRAFNLSLRGEGVMIVHFILTNMQPPYELAFKSGGQVLLIWQGQLLAHARIEDSFLKDKWTTLQIEFSEAEFRILKNNNTLFSYTSGKAMVFYFFSVSVAEGWAVWSANCDPLDIDGTPRDGGWSGWSPWQCTVTCGGGEGFRTRTCTNPTPNVFGRLCPGSHKSTGICNDFRCGDVSYATLEKIRDDLQAKQFGFVVNEGRPVTIENNREALRIVAKESPDAYYEWTHNGVFLSSEGDRVKFQGDNILIRSSVAADAGVYVSMLYRINKQRVVLRVITLAVVTRDYAVRTRATRSMVLTCNAVVLGYVYSDLSLKLLLNGRVYKDFGRTTLAAVNTEHFDNLNTSHQGDWKCVVEQKDLNLLWVTNFVKVEVRKAPNFYTNLMEDEATRPFFGWLKTENRVFYALIFIGAFVLAGVGLFLFVYFKYCTMKTRWTLK